MIEMSLGMRNGVVVCNGDNSMVDGMVADRHNN